MKITPELIQQSPQFTNSLNERQLNLRSYKLKLIENLGATLDFYECIDLSDNELRKLSNFTYLEK
jgi:U2 small nuclear ribonucleoprotein A'